jgi:hypothetical protein
MVRGRLGVALLALVVLTANLSAADNPTVKAIKQQIEALKAQEKVTKKAVHDWYEGFLKRDKVSEEVAAAERKILAAQESELLAVTTDPEARKAIKAQYDSLREYLKVGIKLDEAARKKIVEMRKAHEAHISAAYKIKIAELELAAKRAAGKK